MSITTTAVRRFATEQLARLLPGGFRGRFFLAGGCFKSLLHGQTPHDLDLWPASSEDRTLLLEYLQSQGSVVVEHNQFHTVLQNTAVSCRVEVTCKCPPSLEESVADFDIELACVAAEYAHGRVEHVYIHPGVADCLAAREVRAVSRLKPMVYSLLTLSRLARYGQELGFRVCEKSKRRVWDIYTAATEEERPELLKAAGLTQQDVPSYAAIQRVFVKGRPSEPCRPFTSCELEALKSWLLSNPKGSDTNNCCSIDKSPTRPPVAVYMVGLPAAGKGTVLKEILQSLGLEWKTMVDLDMDHIRSFHGQFNQHLRGVPGPLPGQCTIYQELIPWFNEGANAEQVLYQDPHSLVRELLSHKRDFILPIHSIESLPFMEHVSRLYGYVPYLIEIRVPVSVALERAVTRAKVTGRYTPPACIHDSATQLSQSLPALREFVQSRGVVACFDNSRTGGGGRGPPIRIQENERVAS